MTLSPSKRSTLNDIAVRNLPIPAEGVAQYPDGKIPGMGVRVTSNGVKSFFLAYRVHGKPHRLNLGRYPITTLAEARAKAHAALATVAGGKNPRAPAGGSLTFAAAVTLFVESYCKRYNRASTATETERQLRVNFLPLWGRRSVDTITRTDIVDALEPKMQRGTHAAARHSFAAVRRFFNWLVEQGKLETSPCAGMKPPAKAGSRDRVLSDDELRRIWQAAEAQGWPFGPIVQLLMLTAQRRTEVSAMRWEEVDQAKTIWTIPAERTKNSKPHIVPLSSAALDVLRQIPRTTSEFVFPARGMPEQPYTGWSKGKRMTDAAAGLHDWTLHDLRRTAATGMARAGVAPHVVERVLNHVSGTFAGVAGIYNRFQYADEMRKALDVWERHLTNLLGDTVRHATAQPEITI